MKYLVLLLFPFSSVFGQKDSLFVLAFSSRDCSISKSINQDCILSSDKQILDLTPFTIAKAFYCNSVIGKEKFYEIYLNKERYFIREQNVIIPNVTFEYLLTITDTAKFRLNAIEYSSRIEQTDKDKFDKFYKIAQSKGIALIDFNYYKPKEYLNSISVYFKFYNPTKKAIKYITVNLIALNPVGDKITEFGKNIFTLKAVGPLHSFEFGEYEFENVWFSKVFDTSKILSIKVQYLDGSVKTVSDINSIIMPKDVYRYFIQ